MVLNKAKTIFMPEELGFEENKKMMSFLATRKPKGQGECDDSVFKIMQNKGQGRTDQDFNGSQNGR